MIVHRSAAAFRVAHGRVLLAPLSGGSLDLSGAAAAVWLAADEPCDATELEGRLAGTGLTTQQIVEATDELLAAGLLDRQR